MSKSLTVDDFRESLNGHVAVKGDEIRAKYGPKIGWTELLAILEDRSFVRYPCELAFDASQLLKGELAHPVQKGKLPEEGFKIHIHPFFAPQPGLVPHLVLYQLVLVNYGEFASSDDAETFGSRVLGLDKDEYYKTLCALGDSLEGCCA